MPELPEVETIVRELDDRLTGQVFGRVVLTRRDIVHGDPRPLEELLPGRRVERARRRAKRVILELDRGTELIFHMGMSGRLTVHASNQPIEPHTHLRIAIRKTRLDLRFRDPRRFGGVWCLAGSDTHVGRSLGPLGLEPLDATPAVFRRTLDRSRQIKALLLDQRVIAGLGNIYSDEALHAAGVHPLRQADLLDKDEAGRLLRVIKSTLRRAIRFKGSTLRDYRAPDGTRGSYQRHHRVYGRAGEPCRTCGTMIQRIIAAGRSTFLCQRCQPPS